MCVCVGELSGVQSGGEVLRRPFPLVVGGALVGGELGEELSIDEGGDGRMRRWFIILGNQITCFTYF